MLIKIFVVFISSFNWSWLLILFFILSILVMLLKLELFKIYNVLLLIFGFKKFWYIVVICLWFLILESIMWSLDILIKLMLGIGSLINMFMVWVKWFFVCFMVMLVIFW